MRNYIHNDPEFEELILIVADKLKIDPYLIEKDYWIMHTLYGLNVQGIEFELKGGTSLSKGYGVNTSKTDPLSPAQCDPLKILFQNGVN